MVCDKLCALDFDDLQYGREWWRKHGPLRCAIQTTPRPGVHIILRSIQGVRNAVKVNGLPYDIRGGGKGFIKLYGFLENYADTNPENLDPVRRGWLPVQSPVVSKEIRNVRSYVMAIESKQGESGNSGLVRAIARCRDNGLSIAETTLLIAEWNRSDKVPVSYTHLTLPTKA